jgi:hypothetical protein
MAGETLDPTKNPFLASMQTAQAYNAKLMEFSAMNIGAVFKYAEQLSKVKTPQEFVDVVGNHVRDQFESLTEQVEELSAFVQKAKSQKEVELEPGLGD